jgi:hypothetical protein
MDWEAILKAAVVVVPLLPALAGVFFRPDRSRREMRHDVEIVKDLPEGPAKDAVLELVRHNASQLLEGNRPTIDVSGLALAIVGAGGLGLLGVWLALRGTWWSWLLAAVCAFFWLAFFVGIFDSAQRRDRVAEKKQKAEEKAAKAASKASKRAGSVTG